MIFAIVFLTGLAMWPLPHNIPLSQSIAGQNVALKYKNLQRAYLDIQALNYTGQPKPRIFQEGYSLLKFTVNQ